MTKTRPPVAANAEPDPSAKIIAKATTAGAVRGAFITAVAAVILQLIQIYVDKPRIDSSNLGKNISAEANSVSGDTVELVKAQTLQVALGQAKEKIMASGYIVHYVTADDVSQWVKAAPNLKVAITMVDPLGVKKVICQRQNDEDNKVSNFQKVLSKIKDFHGVTKSLLLEHKLDLRLIDSYPTMSVITVDKDLYAYFYPYKELGTESPILKFSNYKENKTANFFAAHLNAVFYSAKTVNTEAQFQPYKPDNLPDPCLGIRR